MGTSGSSKIVRTLASYIISRSGQGKWVKTGCFRISANYSDAQILRGVHSKNVVAFYAIIFLNQSYGCSKSTESDILSLSQLLCGVTKKTRQQFCVLSSDMNRTSKVPCQRHDLFIWRLETQNCSRAFFVTPPLCKKIL